MKSILLIEDDPLISHNIRRVLGGSGHRIVTAYTAAEGLQRALTDAPFDLLVLDIGLPDGSGIDLARELRRRRHTVPLIFLTAYEDEATVQAAIDCEAHAYLVKPVTNRQLLPLIESALATLSRQAEQTHGMVAAIDNNRAIGTATGMLAERWRCSPDAAFEILRRQARKHQIKVETLARQLITGEIEADFLE